MSPHDLTGREVTRRLGPATVVVGAVAFVTGLPAGWLGSFSRFHQVSLLVHAAVGSVALGAGLLFTARHFGEITGRRRSLLWLSGITLYLLIREIALRESVPWLYVLEFAVPVVLVAWLAERRIARWVIGLAIGVPLAGLGLAWATGHEVHRSAFPLFYYAELLCLLAAYVGRPGTLDGASPRERTIRTTGAATTFALVASGISGILLGAGAGQMQVGGPFIRAHEICSYLVAAGVLAHLVLIRRRVAARRLQAPTVPHTTRWRPAAATGALVTAVALGVLPGWVAKHDPEHAAAPFDAETMAAPSRWTLASGRVTTWWEFGNSATCAPCHPTQMRHWEESGHRHAGGPVFREVLAEVREAVGPDGERYCLGCHAPTAIVTGELAGGGPASQASLDAGVGCAACHLVEAAAGAPDTSAEPGNGSHVVADDPRLLFERTGRFTAVTGMLSRLAPRLHSRRYAKPHLPDSRMCAGCHVERLDPPRFGAHPVVLQDPYTSWSESRFGEVDAAGRVAVPCNGCHMPRTELSEFQESVSDHRFFGGSAALARLRGEDDAAEAIDSWLAGDREALLAASRERVQRFYEDRDDVAQLSGVSERGFEATVDALFREKIEADGPFPDETLWPSGSLIEIDVACGEPSAGEIGVGLVNRAIGHSFPTAPADIFDAWLAVEVRDASGVVRFESGGEARVGAPRPPTRTFGGVAIDASGNPIRRHRIWEIVGHRDRVTLDPGVRHEERYSLPVEMDATETFDVRVRLLYRLPGAAIVSDLLGPDADLPTPAVLGGARTTCRSP